MQRKEASKEILGLNRITKKRILELCRKNELYQTPELNDVLYLHYQGFDCIDCLEEYTELKCLWMECNAISEIQGLDKQTKLKCLFLQSNLIRKIENLEYCKELDTLNLSQNHIRKIENCDFEILPVLNTLNLSSNYLRDCEGLRELENCKNLSVLDLSNNRIDDILVVKIFSQMPELKVLVLQGNPVVSKIPQYRKTLILECKKLTYLDSRPVFPKDRACAEAWKRGGYQEERKENERWNRKERKKMRDSVNATIHLRNKHRKLADQISLIPSSDSQDDTKEQKSNIRIQADSETSTDSVWDEVTHEKNSDRSLIANTSEKSESKRSTENGNIDIMIDGDVHTEAMEDQTIGEKKQMQETTQKIFGIRKDSASGFEMSKPQSKLDENNIFQITNQKYSDVDQQESYEATIKAIEKIGKSENFSETLLKKYSSKETLDSAEEIAGDNYEPLKELDTTMNIFSQLVTYDQASCQIETKTEKPIQEFAIEQEYLKVNSQLKSDFEELTTNMGHFVNQLEREQEERQEVIKALFCKEIAAKESSCESSDNENVDSLDNLELERMLNQWDNETKKENIENIVQRTVNASETGTIVNSTDKLLNNEENITNYFVTNKNTEKGSTGSFEYIPMDISLLTRKSNEALISLERESKELKKLLQKLENNNEELFKAESSEEKNQREDTNCGNKLMNLAGGKGNNENLFLDKNNEIYNKNIQEDFKKTKGDRFYYNSYTNEDRIQVKAAVADKEEEKQIVEEILEEILESFDTLYNQQKSHLFPLDLTENNKADDLTSNKAASGSIPEVIESFNQFLNEIEINPRTKEKRFSEKLDNQKRKSLILKELSKQSYLKQFNSDTLQSLDDELEEIKRNQHEKARRVVDRVCAQKDRYNDTIELVDDKLMVYNQCSKELRALHQSLPQDSSDSEADYDTAHSDEEGSNNTVNLRKEQFGQRSFKPTARKSSEELIIKALLENKSNDDTDDSNDEFYSLEFENKPNLYNIDKEFLNKLTFDLSNLTQIDENYIVQCARSYEELKHCLKVNKDKRCLTEQEHEMLENMIRRKCVKVRENPENFSEYLSKQEQLGLNEITLKAEELKSKERLKVQSGENTCNDKLEKYELEKSAEKILTKTFFGDIFENKEEIHECLYDKIMHESISTVEPRSEEEKNEIESNIDFERAAEDTKTLNCQEILEIRADKEDISSETNVKKSANIFGDAEILEIIADNDEIVDARTLNAELHL